MIGKRFGSWRVIGVGQPNAEGRKRYRCRCRCGTLSDIRATDFTRGRSTRCRPCGQRGNRKGWIHGAMAGVRAGGKPTPEYSVWKGMIQRCTNPKAIHYERYGGRGIRVYRRWRGPKGFVNFLQDVGKRPSTKCTLDRIDNNCGYEPENVRWVSRTVQQRNRYDNQRLKFGRSNLTLQEWSERTGLRYATLRGRLRSGWSVRDILKTPRCLAMVREKGRKQCVTS